VTARQPPLRVTLESASEPREEQVVVVFVASEEAATLAAVRRGLGSIGLDLYVASSVAPSVPLDYENARYLIVLIEGTADGRAPTDAIEGPRIGTKAIVFPGVPVSEPPDGSVRLDVGDEDWPAILTAAIAAVSSSSSAVQP
jgi:hypothetical protein